MDASEERCAQLAAQVRALSDGKYALDVRVSELSAKLGSADGELSAARAEVRSSRGEASVASLPALLCEATIAFHSLCAYRLLFGALSCGGEGAAAESDKRDKMARASGAPLTPPRLLC